MTRRNVRSGGTGDTISPTLISASALVLLQIAGATVFALFPDVRGIWLANAFACVVCANSRFLVSHGKVTAAGASTYKSA
jgi:hypothetical protein